MKIHAFFLRQMLFYTLNKLLCTPLQPLRSICVAELQQSHFSLAAVHLMAPETSCRGQ